MKISSILIMTALVAGPAVAQEPLGAGLGNSMNNWYKQNVYDASQANVGDVKDVLLTPDGKAYSLVIGVGGFLGIGEKNVVVPFERVKRTVDDGKPRLTIDTTKDAMKAEPGYTYDNKTLSWLPEAAQRDPTVTK